MMTEIKGGRSIFESKKTWALIATAGAVSVAGLYLWLKRSGKETEDPDLKKTLNELADEVKNNSKVAVPNLREGAIIVAGLEVAEKSKTLPQKVKNLFFGLVKKELGEIGEKPIIKDLPQDIALIGIETGRVELEKSQK